ncbi:Tail-anchored protein insertion receptor WRB [Sarcoptes scabiei]|uniref:Guided entry of tail-anchored proteins factor 1 n=1 Tax=Sarcoptes scabiei TaxID=52283 RepID=A0A834RGE7_SARSC|nr:Tail-anchored protein insertion receptor WRB [Sarcoptes scabiei]
MMSDLEDLPSQMEQFDLLMFYMITSISLFNAFIPTIVSLLLNLFIWDSKIEKSLKVQISDLKEELGFINMTDEFAKYSKIQRKLNKISDELKNKNNRQFLYQTKTRMILYVILYGISGIIFFLINWNHFRKPLLFFVSDNLFYPFGPLLAFPTGQSSNKII